jgi:predicted dehydrogenase
MESIRVGVIGSGGIFRSLHAPYFEQTQRAKIVAVADVNEKNAQEQAKRFGAEAYTDYRRLLERKDVDAVDVCTHPAPHRDITVAAAQTGKHILLEKPMCRTVAEADEMIAAAKKAGVLLQVAYMMRFNPHYMKLKEMLEDGTLGAVHLAYCSQIGWFPPLKHPWLFVREQSGGMLVEQAIHNLDIWLYLFGPVKTVYAQTSQVPLGGTYPSDPKKAVENNATLVVQFEKGGTGMLIKSWAAEVGLTGEGVICAKGSGSASTSSLKWKTHAMKEAQTFAMAAPDDDTYRNVAPEARARNYWGYASKGRGIEHWLKCIAGEEKATTSGEVGRAGIEIAEAAYRSALSGKRIALPL